MTAPPERIGRQAVMSLASGGNHDPQSYGLISGKVITRQNLALDEAPHAVQRGVSGLKVETVG
jgi:hypothetical protein